MTTKRGRKPKTPEELSQGPTPEMVQRQEAAHGVRTEEGKLSWGLDPLTVLARRHIITQDEEDAGRDLQRCYMAKFGSPFATGSRHDYIRGKSEDNEYLQKKFDEYDRLLRDFGPRAVSLMREIVIFEDLQEHRGLYGFIIDGRVTRGICDNGDFWLTLATSIDRPQRVLTNGRLCW